MHEFFSAAWTVTLELAPWLLLGTIVSGILHIALPHGFLRRSLSGRGGVWKAVLFGVPLPLCSCGVIPAGIGLKKDGASDGAAIGFLISTPQTGVDSVLVSASFLGWPFALFKVIAAAVTGLVGGRLTQALRGSSAHTPADLLPDARTSKPLRAFLDHSTEVLESLWRWLVFGVLVSAAISTFVPTSTFTALAAQGAAVTSLAVLAVSVPFYVCAVASVPIAAVMVANGLPAGAALVFLMAGPATNVATIGAIYRTFGRGPLAIYLGTLMIGSLLAGWLFDSVITTGSAHAMMHDHHGAGPITIASAIALMTILALLALRDLRAAIARLRPAPKQDATIELQVTGMSCKMCANKVERAVRDVEGISACSVSVEDGQATVSGSAPPDAVVKAIDALGYKASLSS